MYKIDFEPKIEYSGRTVITMFVQLVVLIVVTLSLFFAAIALMLWIGDIRASEHDIRGWCKKYHPELSYEACQDEAGV